MPSLLLDHHVTEAAMSRTSTDPGHRWSRRRRTSASVATVVAAAPVTHRPAAAHLSGSHANRPVMFDDIDRDYQMPPGWIPARSGNQLDHAAVMVTIAELRAEPLPDFDRHAAKAAPVASVPVDDIEATGADVARLFAAAGYVYLPIRIRIAPIAELLAEPLPATDWLRAIESAAEFTAGRFDALTARVGRAKGELATFAEQLAEVA